MKKLFLLSLIALSANAFAQSETTSTTAKQKFAPKSYIEVSAGVAVPLGNYAKTDYANNKAGFAGVGSTVALSGVGYIKHSNWGIAGYISYSSFAPKGLANLAAGYQEDFDIDSTRIHSGSYHSINLLLGPAYSYSFGIVTLDFSALGGVNLMYSPRIDVLVNDGGTSFTNGGTDYSFWQKSAFTSALAVQLGAGIRVEPVKHFGISARVNYNYSQPVFNLENEYRTNNAGRLLNSYTQPLHIINATIGFSYNF